MKTNTVELAYKAKAVKEIERMFEHDNNFNLHINVAGWWAERLVMRTMKPSKQALRLLKRRNTCLDKIRELQSQLEKATSELRKTGWAWQLHNRDVLAPDTNNLEVAKRVSEEKEKIQLIRRKFIQAVYASDTVEDVGQVIEDAADYAKTMSR